MRIELTEYAKNRILKRKINEEEVFEAIKNPDKINIKHGKHLYQKKLEQGIIEVVCEKTVSILKVITIYWL